MPIDPSEKIFYMGRKGEPYWWLSGIKVPPPPANPRNLLWTFPDEHGSVLVLTLDLRDLKLYARFAELAPETEAKITCW